MSKRLWVSGFGQVVSEGDVMNFKSWFKRSSTRKIAALEAQLDTALDPVGPRPEFISRLRSQLVPPPGKRYLGIPAERWGIGVGVFGVILATVILVQNGLRLVVGVLAALGLVQQARKKAMQEQNDVPLKPAQ